jgi:hypothetical protein
MTISIPIPGLGKTFEIPSAMLSAARSDWTCAPSGPSTAKRNKAKERKKLLKKL